MRWFTVANFLVYFVGGVNAQTVDSLTDSEKIEYNRNKLTIEVVGQTTGNFGGSSYGGLFGGRSEGTAWKQWTAYKGMGNPIKESEFYTLVGYDDEAARALMREEKITNAMTFGPIASIGGLILMYIPKTETVHYEYLGDIEETTYPFLWPGALVSLAGSGFWYWGSQQRRINFSPASTVQQIAEDFNQNLLSMIIKARQ
jgi:hypothetical protein